MIISKRRQSYLYYRAFHFHSTGFSEKSIHKTFEQARKSDLFFNSSKNFGFKGKVLFSRCLQIFSCKKQSYSMIMKISSYKKSASQLVRERYNDDPDKIIEGTRKREVKEGRSFFEYFKRKNLYYFKYSSFTTCINQSTTLENSKKENSISSTNQRE